MIKLKLVNGDTKTTIINRTIKNTNDVRKIVKSLKNYEVPVVPEALYNNLKHRNVSKDKLKKLVDKIIHEMSTDITTTTKLVLDMINKSRKRFNISDVDRTIEITIVYYVTRHFVLAKDISLITNLGIVRKEYEIKSKGFFMHEICELTKLFRSGVVTAENNVVKVYSCFDVEGFCTRGVDYIDMVFEWR